MKSSVPSSSRSSGTSVPSVLPTQSVPTSEPAAELLALREENARLRTENSELRSQLDWHPIGSTAVHARETLPLDTGEVPPPIAEYIRNPHKFLDQGEPGPGL